MPIRFIAPAKAAILSSEEGALVVAWLLSHGIYAVSLVTSSALPTGGLKIDVDLGVGQLLTGGGYFGLVVSYTLIAVHLGLRFWRKSAEIKKIEEETRKLSAAADHEEAEAENQRIENEILKRDSERDN